MTPLLWPALGWLAAPHPDGDDIRRQAEKVFTRPEFAPPDGPSWLLRYFRAFFEWLAGLHDNAPLHYWLLLGSCVVLLLLIIAHIAWTVHKVFSAGPRQRGERPEARRRRLSATFWDEARACAARGELTEAVRCLFLSLVYRFDEAGKIHFEQSYTNREYLGLFADRPAIYSQLKVFVDTLDDHWYGQQPTGQQQYEQCLSLYQTLDRAG